MPKVKAASLVLDMNLYPRHHMDQQCIADYAEAMRAGAKFPPITVDRKSRRVVDGWKRTTAALRFGGEDAVVDVEFHDYADEKALLLESISLNATHGEKLTHYDVKRCILLCENLKIAVSQVALALNLTLDKFAVYEKGLHRKLDGTALVCSKASSTHIIKSGRVPTKQQMVGITKVSGMQPIYQINQVAMLIEYKLLDEDNPKVMEAFMRLYELMKGVVGRVKAA